MRNAYRKRGPKFKLTPEQVAELRKEMEEDQRVTVDVIADRYQVSKATLYNALARPQEGAA